jgi:hypothetical protein
LNLTGWAGAISERPGVWIKRYGRRAGVRVSGWGSPPARMIVVSLA